MAERILGPTGSPKRRRFLFVPIVMVALLAVFWVAGAQAVHDDGLFELDKNTTNDLNTSKLGELGTNATDSATSINVCETGTAPATPFTILVEAERMTVTANAAGSFGGNCASKREYTVTRAAGGTTATAHAKGGVDGFVSLLVAAPGKPGTDWNQVYASVTADANDTGDDDKCTALGLVECSYIEDGIGPTTFTGGGTKDHLPVSGWSHTSGASPDKAEILNAYAAKGISGGNQILYFGMDRYAVDGSTDIGFWFFKNPVVANPDGTFTGNQALNDVLILGTFTQGGATSNIRVFKWVGTGGNESGTIQGPDATFGDCVPGSAGDNGCATVNDTSVEVPWNYTFKGSAKSGWVPAGGGFEGGVDLTALGLAGCFSSFLAETRSSPEITAILKDFALGSFEACGSTLSTTPGDGTTSGTALTDSNANSIPDISIGTGSVTVKDRATLNITGISTWSGTMDFWLCKVDAPGLCDGTTNVGTKIGASIPVTQATTQPILSAAATVTSAGRYCWRGEFTSTTTGVPNATDSSIGECFEVLPKQPAITTNATASVTIGSPISDSATLSGTANKPGTPVINPTTAGGPAGGTITFVVYGPDDATCTGTPAHTSAAVPVSGNDTYSSGNFTPTAAGTYRWIASYSGDSPNTLSVAGACNDANETTVVSPKQPTISTNATAGPVTLGSSINDTATLGNTSPKPNGDPAGGTITFTAYGPFANTTTCTGDPVYTSVVNVSGNGTYSAADGTGGTFTPTAAGTYNWIAVYSGDSPNTLGVSGSCGDANEGSVVISLQPTMSTAQRFVPNDAATITVASNAGGDLAGSVVFKLYVDNATCTGTADYTSPAIDITTGTGTGLSRTVVSGNTVAYTATGTTFHWVVEYTSTKAAHQNVTSGCGNEHSSITVSNGVTQPSS